MAEQRVCQDAGAKSLEKRPGDVPSFCLAAGSLPPSLGLRLDGATSVPAFPWGNTNVHPPEPSPLTYVNTQQPQDQGGRWDPPHVSAEGSKAWPLQKPGAGPRSMLWAREESRGDVVGDGGGGGSGWREGASAGSARVLSG